MRQRYNQNNNDMDTNNILKIMLATRSYIDHENGNPYYAFRAKVITRNAYDVIIECAGDWGSCGASNILEKWALPAINNTLGVSLTPSDTRILHYSHKKMRSIRSLETPGKWAECR